MPEIKRTPDTPPTQLEKTVTSLSKSDNWKEAKEEWNMDKYFYNASSYKACPCSPREVRNLTVLRNRYNFNELEVCNSCAERYFGIGESSRIEAAVRRIKKDPICGMGFFKLCYLFINKGIDRNEFNRYSTISRLSKDHKILRIMMKITNMKLLQFTDYRHRSFLKKFDAILVAAAKNPEISVGPVHDCWRWFIDKGIADESFLDALIERHGIPTSNLDMNELRSAKMLLDSCIRTGLLSDSPHAIVIKEKEYKDDCPYVESGPLFHKGMLIGLVDINGEGGTLKSLDIDYDSSWMRSELSAIAEVYRKAEETSIPVSSNRLEYSYDQEGQYEDDEDCEEAGGFEHFESAKKEHDNSNGDFFIPEFKYEAGAYMNDEDNEADRPDMLKLLEKCGWPVWIRKLPTPLVIAAFGYDSHHCNGHIYKKFGSYGLHKKMIMDRLDTLDNVADFRTLKEFYGFDNFTDYDEDDRNEYYLDFINAHQLHDIISAEKENW